MPHESLAEPADSRTGPDPHPVDAPPDFGATLRAHRVETARQREAVQLSLDLVRGAKGDGTADDEHDPDGPTLSAEWSQLTGLHSLLERDEVQIDRALARIANSTFGFCLSCGGTISRARLEARPAAEFCIACARAREGR